MDRLITIATFQYPHQAYIVKNKLDDHGIDSFIIDEINPEAHRFNTRTAGAVKLQVAEEEVKKAIPILEATGFLETNSEDEKSKLWQNLERITGKIPLIKKWSTEIRIVATTGILLFILGFLFFLSTLPSKADRLAAKNRYEQALIENRFIYYFLPRLDRLTETNPEEAIMLADSLINSQIYAGNFYLYERMGLALHAVDSFERAIEYYNLSMRYKGYEYPIALWNISSCKIQLKDYDGAIEALSKATERDYDYYLDLAQTYELKGDLDSALVACHKYAQHLKEWKQRNPIDQHKEGFTTRVEALNEISKRIKKKLRSQ